MVSQQRGRDAMRGVGTKARGVDVGKGVIFGEVGLGGFVRLCIEIELDTSVAMKNGSEVRGIW
ncbi:hypothetical protein ACPCYY_19740 [Bacillus pumilus]|uniref:hypothetical protein n=1 Tax=Bacillus pumilus TaxID=1408 RepID=UPI003C1B2A13